jgi:hypothetical protein
MELETANERQIIAPTNYTLPPIRNYPAPQSRCMAVIMALSDCSFIATANSIEPASIVIGADHETQLMS